MTRSTIAILLSLILPSCATCPQPSPQPPAHHCHVEQFATFAEAQLIAYVDGYTLSYAPYGIAVEIPFEAVGGVRTWLEMLAVRVCDVRGMR